MTLRTEFFKKAKETLVDPWFNRTMMDIQNLRTFLTDINLEQWVQIGALANSSLLSLVNIHHLYQSFATRNLPDENVIRLVMRQRESAVTSYKQASESFRDGSHGKALNEVNSALAEFTKTLLQKYNIEEMRADETLQAEMLLLKAICQLFLAKSTTSIKSVISTLQAALKLDNNLIVAHNTLILINVHLIKNPSAAKTNICSSLDLSQQQIFANYYHAKLNDDEKGMSSAIESLIRLFQDKKMMESEGKSSESTAWRNLQATTLPCMAVFLVSDWLDYSATHAKQAETLVAISKYCASFVWTQSEDIIKRCCNMILETRIRALRRISFMKRSATVFEAYDDEWRNEYCH